MYGSWPFLSLPKVTKAERGFSPNYSHIVKRSWEYCYFQSHSAWEPSSIASWGEMGVLLGMNPSCVLAPFFSRRPHGHQGWLTSRTSTTNEIFFVSIPAASVGGEEMHSYSSVWPADADAEAWLSSIGSPRSTKQENLVWAEYDVVKRRPCCC